MTGVAWGVDYVADEHADEALRNSPRSGAAVAHEDTPALAEKVADALLRLPFRTWDFGDSVTSVRAAGLHRPRACSHPPRRAPG